jgi:hypothetical protein
MFITERSKKHKGMNSIKLILTSNQLVIVVYVITIAPSVRGRTNQSLYSPWNSLRAALTLVTMLAT